VIFRATPIEGVVEILAEKMRDIRGAFLRQWCQDDFAAAGIAFHPRQISVSENTRCHTLRGMHYQAAPAEEQKLVRCIRGAVFDVALDLRPDSPTRLRSFGVVLDANEANALFIPRGCAHGFLTLTDDAAVEYAIDAPYAPALARGVRWNDAAFGIAWPAAPLVISDRDRDWPDHG
jgi:dTDP-4-dehydrorhamnose 3,5-epimerase